MATKDITKLGIGGYNVSYKGVSLGYTSGGSTFSYDPQFVDMKVDDYGETPVDKIINGELVTVKVRLAQVDLETLNQAIPVSTLNAGKTKLEVGSVVGTSLRDSAGVLILTPFNSSTNEIITVWKATVASAVVLEGKTDTQVEYEVEFFALPDTTRSAGKQLYTIGDTAAA